MKQIALLIAFIAGVVNAAPVVTGSVSSAFSGTSGSVAVCNGVGDLIVAVVSANDVPGTALFSTPDAGWSDGGGTWSGGYTKVGQNISLAVFSKLSDGTETNLTVNNPVSVNAQATVFCVSGASNLALKSTVGRTALVNPPYRTVGTVGDLLAVAVGAWGGSAPVALPGGYGFPIHTGSNLSLSFRSLVGNSEDPGPYSMSVAGKWHALTLVIY